VLPSVPILDNGGSYILVDLEKSIPCLFTKSRKLKELSLKPLSLESKLLVQNIILSDTSFLT
jgi:hypothetical protein